MNRDLKNGLLMLLTFWVGVLSIIGVFKALSWAFDSPCSWIDSSHSIEWKEQYCE